MTQQPNGALNFGDSLLWYEVTGHGTIRSSGKPQRCQCISSSPVDITEWLRITPTSQSVVCLAHCQQPTEANTTYRCKSSSSTPEQPTGFVLRAMADCPRSCPPKLPPELPKLTRQKEYGTLSALAKRQVARKTSAAPRMTRSIFIG